MNLWKVGLFLLGGIGAAGTLRAAVPASSVPSFLPGARSVLWVGAHPDDEVLAAPLLARWCLDEKLRCTFLIFTSASGANACCRAAARRTSPRCGARR